MSKVCVVVLNYFSHKNTEACVKSLINQRLDTLYLVDNSADKQQAEFIYEIADRLTNCGATFAVTVLISESNVGFGAGINFAIKHDFKNTGGHDLYLLLNNDTVLPQNTLEVLIEEKSNKPNVALLSPKINWGGEVMCYRGYIALLGHVTKQPTRLAAPYLTGCCLLVEAELIDENNSLFDEEFFMYGEDIWLNWKAQQLGKEIYCTDKVTIFHEGTGSTTHGNFFYEFHVARGHILLAKKLGNTMPYKIAMVVGRLFYLPARSILRCFRYRKMDPLKALVEAFR